MAQVYKGRRLNGRAVVTEFDPLRDEIPHALEPALLVRDYGSTGFAWGEDSPGAMQLALAILMDATGNGDTAIRYAFAFRKSFLDGIEGDQWEMDADLVRAEVATLQWLAGEISIPEAGDKPCP